MHKIALTAAAIRLMYARGDIHHAFTTRVTPSPIPKKQKGYNSYNPQKIGQNLTKTTENSNFDTGVYAIRPIRGE